MDWRFLSIERPTLSSFGNSIPPFLFRSTFLLLVHRPTIARVSGNLINAHRKEFDSRLIASGRVNCKEIHTATKYCNKSPTNTPIAFGLLNKYFTNAYKRTSVRLDEQKMQRIFLTLLLVSHLPLKIGRDKVISNGITKVSVRSANRYKSRSPTHFVDPDRPVVRDSASPADRLIKNAATDEKVTGYGRIAGETGNGRSLAAR